VDSILVGGVATAATDTIPPQITVSLPNGNAAAGATVEAVIEDASGINLTQLFEFRSLQFAVLDEAGVERFRTDVTSQFSYDEGSHTKGRVSMNLPELPEGDYTVRLIATDNYNNRGEGTLEIRLSSTSTAAVSAVYGLPNPFSDATLITWALKESGTVKLSIFSVSGRKVRDWSVEGVRGENRFPWDGTDQRGDPVANGVYLVRVATQGSESVDVIEPIVRVR